MEERIYESNNFIVTMPHSVMWVYLCIPGHIHCPCSTVMALLCIPVSELVHSLQVVTDPFSMHVHLFQYFYYLIQYYSNNNNISNMNYMTIYTKYM